MRIFKPSLPMSLLKAREAVMKTFIPYLREHEVSSQQRRVLRGLFDRAGIEITDLSEICFLLMPSLSRIIQNLESRELVLRRKSPTDQRKSIISLTESGKKLVEVMAPEPEAQYRLITETFGYGKLELELLYELLDELVDKLEENSDTKL